MEREQSKEKIQPNEIINRAINYYLLGAIEQGLLKQTGETKAVLGIIEHLTQSGAFEKGEAFPKKELFEAEKNQVLELGKIAFDALNQKRDIKDLAKGKFDPRLIAYAPQALLVYSYLPLLENLKEIVHGEKEYGYGKELDRLQPHNSLAAGEMMKMASKRIADDMVNLVTERGLRNIKILELGCGNASFSAEVLTTFKSHGLELPDVLATDLNPKTQITAINLFKEKGFENKLEVMEVDMGNINKLRETFEKLDGKTVIVHIGYILHENRELAVRTVKGLTEVFADKNVIFAFSEYYLQNEISPEVPLWFQTIHEITQELFTRDELISFVENFGLTKIYEVKHNVRKDNGEVMNSTTFWEVQNNYYERSD